MELNLIVESKSFENDKDMQTRLENNPCDLCLFGQGLMCVERKHCRWKTHKEIFIKKVVETREKSALNISDVFKRKNIDWKGLRDRFFVECTYEPSHQSTGTGSLKKISLAPHDLFQWFKNNI